MSTAIDNEILRMLKYGRSEDIKRYFSEKKKNAYPMDFPTFINEMLKEHKVSRKNVAIRAGLSQDYTYKLLRGDKKTTERDYIIAICMAIGMNIAQTQHALECCEMPVLNTADMRSQVIYLAISENKDIDTLNNWLEKAGFVYLKTSPEMPSAKIELINDSDQIFHSVPAPRSKATEPEYDEDGELIPMFEELGHHIHAEPCGLAPMDFMYWGEISVKDRLGNKFFIQAAYSDEGDSLIVMTEDQFRKAEETKGEIVETIESYESLEDSAVSEFFQWFLRLDRLTDLKVKETLENVDDTRNYGMRIGGGLFGGQKINYAEVFNLTEPGKREYLQIYESEEETIYSASHESYYMRMELGDLYSAYFGEKKEPEYFVKVNDLSDLKGEYSYLRFIFTEIQYKMHEQVMENWGDIALTQADTTDEQIAVLAQHAAHNAMAGRHEESISELEEMLELMDKNPASDKIVIRANTYYKLALSNQATNDPEAAHDYWKRLYDLKKHTQFETLSENDAANAKGCIGTAAVELADHIQNHEPEEDPKPYIKEAIALLEGNCDANNEWISLFRAYGKLAFCIDTTDPEEACRLYRKSLKIAREQSLYKSTVCKIAVTSIYNNYAWTLWNCLGSEEAIIYYGQALDLLEGYLSDGDLEKDIIISQMKHIGQALAKVYDQTNHANEKARLIARLSEENIEID